MRHYLLLAGLLMLAPHWLLAADLAKARARVDQLGARLDQLYAQGGLFSALDNDMSLHRLWRSDAVGQEEVAYFQHLTCAQPEEALRLIAAWTTRLEVWAGRTADIEDEFAGIRGLLESLGLGPSLLLLQIGEFGSECPQAALSLLKQAPQLAVGRFPGDQELLQARMELTRLGIQLRWAPTRAAAAQLLDTLKRMLQAGHRSSQLEDYDSRLRNMAFTAKAPRWRAGRYMGKALPLLYRYQSDCYSRFPRLLNRLAWSTLPNEVVVLAALGERQAAGAYALAELFETPERGHRGIAYDPVAVVFDAWGKEQVRAELERAVGQIEFVDNGAQQPAILHLFGHEFLIESGEEEATGTRWYSQQKVIERFRVSTVYQRLTSDP